MAELRALIFDVDGTLAETEFGHLRAFNLTFSDHGLAWEWSDELYGKLLEITGGKERLRHYINHYQPPMPDVADFDEFIAQLHRDKTDCYRRVLTEKPLPLRSGVARLLREARAANLILAVATTTHAENVHALLQHSLAPDAVEWFSVIAAGDVVPTKKPAPDIYHYALEKLGLDANQCIAFEDSRNGLLSAIGAGIPTLVTPGYYTQQQNFAEGLLVVDHLGEPDAGFKVLQGEVGEARYVDVALLRKLASA